MSAKLKMKLFAGFLLILSAGILFALGDTSSLLEELVNYPNPFDSRKEQTFISYQLSQDLPVRICIYDLFGMLVKEYRFYPGEEGARSGINTIQWDGTDRSGSKVSKGGYICQVTVEGDLPVRGLRKIGVIH